MLEKNGKYEFNYQNKNIIKYRHDNNINNSTQSTFTHDNNTNNSKQSTFTPHVNILCTSEKQKHKK